MNFIKEIAGKVADILGKVADPQLMLAVAGMALVIVVFLITLIIAGNSFSKKFKKQLASTTAYLGSNGPVGEENVEGLNAQIQAMPASVNKGWSFFLEQRLGYPSDYIAERDVFADKKYSPKYKAGKTFFGVFSAIFIIATVVLAVGMYWADAKATLSFVELFKGANLKFVGYALLGLVGPLLVYVIFAAILSGIYKGQYNKLLEKFTKFQDALDENVIIYKDDEEEFLSENLAEINAAIDDIIADKLNKRDIIEIFTTPKIEEKEIVSDIQEPAPEAPEVVVVPEPEEVVAAAAPEPAPAPAPVITEEVRNEILGDIIELMDKAVADPKITSDELVALATTFENALNEFKYDEEATAVLSVCLERLASKFYGDTIE